MFETDLSSPQFLGAAASLSAALCWSLSTCVYGYYHQVFTAYGLNIFRNAVAAFWLVFAVFLWGHLSEVSVGDGVLLALSGLAGITLGDTASLESLRRLGPQVASSSLCLSPPIAAVIAWVFLGESLSLKECFGLLITLGGVSGVLYLKTQGEHTVRKLSSTDKIVGVSAALISPLAHAIGAVFARSALSRVDVFSATLLRIVPALIGLTLFSFWLNGKPQWSFRLRRPHWILILAATFGSFLGVSLLSLGLKYSKVGVATVLSSTYPIWVIPLSFVFLKEKCHPLGVVSILIAVMGVCLLLANA